MRERRGGWCGGCILANIDGGATDVDADPHVIPAIHIDNVQGDTLKAWLATGTGHQGIIDPTPAPVHNPDVADIMASFSSRGPFTGFEFLAPSVSAPGVDVLASGANLQFHHPGFDDRHPNDPAVAGDYGSSAARRCRPRSRRQVLPRQLHAAGAVPKSSRPDDHGRRRCARKRRNARIVFDFGGGRIMPPDARAGLVLDETVENFEAANPAPAATRHAERHRWFQWLRLDLLVARIVRNATDGPVSYHVSTSGARHAIEEPQLVPLDGRDTGAVDHRRPSARPRRRVQLRRVQLNPDAAQGADSPTAHPVAAFFATSSDRTRYQGVDKEIAGPGETVTYQIDV